MFARASYCLRASEFLNLVLGGHRGLFSHFLNCGPRVEAVLVGGEALSSRKVELPAVQSAGQYTVLLFPKARQVGLEVWATALDHEVATFPQLPYRRRLGVVVLRVAQALRGEDLEEVVDILVVGTAALRLEATGEEETVNPVLLVVEDLVLDQGRIYAEEVIVGRLLAILVHPSLLEVEDHLLPLEVEEHPTVDPNAVQIGLLQERLEPLLECWEDIYLAPRQACLDLLYQGLLANLVFLQVRAFIGEDSPDPFVGQRVFYRAIPSLEGGDAARDHRPAVVQAVLPHELEEDRLVGEDVRRVAIEVVKVKEVVVQEAR